MKKILGLIICGVLVLGVTGCGNNNKSNNMNDNLDNKVETKEELNNSNETTSEENNESYDKVIHCDIPAGTAGTRADEDKGSYYEYYIKSDKLVKYVRYRVLPEQYASRINEYVSNLKNQGYKNVEKSGKTVTIIIESKEDAPEDNNPLYYSINSLEENTNADPNCYIK